MPLWLTSTTEATVEKKTSSAMSFAGILPLIRRSFGMDSKQGVNKTLSTRSTTIWITTSITRVGLLIPPGPPPTPSLAQRLTTLSIPTSTLTLRSKYIDTRYMLPLAFGLLRLSVIITSTPPKTRSPLLLALPLNAFGLANALGLLLTPAGNVADSESYINAAFRSSRTNDVYLFMKNEHVLLDYAPGSTNDKINYALGTTNDKIIKGPMTIATMFPFFKKTVFKIDVDAAFEATTSYEAYLFKDDHYALINYM
ncbi:hypothetical protein ACSBR2_029367 [Camellia fascicularis]